jgi:thioredoxin-like negative regulator of GroEL
VQAAAGEMAGKGVIVQINTQENPRITARYGITGIPATIFFRDGKEIERASGSMGKNNFLVWWRSLLDK